MVDTDLGYSDNNTIACGGCYNCRKDRRGTCNNVPSAIDDRHYKGALEGCTVTCVSSEVGTLEERRTSAAEAAELTKMKTD